MDRYNEATILKTANTNRPYYKARFYPNVPLSENDVYVITTVGDRLDSLAYSYYNDSTGTITSIRLSKSFLILLLLSLSLSLLLLLFVGNAATR
jgi:hypothetical protein